MTFRDDESRIRKDHAPANFTTLKHIAYNLIRLVMLEASRRQQVPVERISFIDALRWLRDAGPDTPLTPLVVNPARPDRLEPRVLKRRMKEYPLMKKPRGTLRKRLLRKERAA